MPIEAQATKVLKLQVRKENCEEKRIVHNGNEKLLPSVKVLTCLTNLATPPSQTSKMKPKEQFGQKKHMTRQVPKQFPKCSSRMIGYQLGPLLSNRVALNIQQPSQQQQSILISKCLAGVYSCRDSRLHRLVENSSRVFAKDLVSKESLENCYSAPFVSYKKYLVELKILPIT